MKYLIIFVICVPISISRASQSRLSDGLRDAENKIEDDFRYVEDQAVNEWNEIKTKTMDSCRCSNYNCGCCAYLKEPEIHLNSTICVNVSYLVHDYGISFTVTVNDYTIFNETVSARNPPPVCIGLPYVKEYADACIRLYDVDATTYHLHACVRVEARLKRILIAKYELGCFNIGPPGLTSENKRVKVQENHTSEESNVANMPAVDSEHIQVKVQEHQTSEGSNATNMTAAVVGIMTGLFMVMALTVFVAIVLARKKGKAHYKGLLGNECNLYGSLVSTAQDGSPKC